MYGQYERPFSPAPARLEDDTRKEMEEGQRHVGKVKQQASEKKVGVKTDVVIGTTSVVKEIVEYAENNKVDMIIMIGFTKMLLGRVPSDVVTYSHCSVLVVK